MIFECEMCHNFADDGDILNRVCLSCIDGFGASPECEVSNSSGADNCYTDCN